MTLEQVGEYEEWFKEQDLPMRFEITQSVTTNNLRETVETCFAIIRSNWGRERVVEPRFDDLIQIKKKLIGYKSH